MTKTKLTKASDYNCCVCGEPAVALWPTIDLDIPSKPYCRECLDKTKGELLRQLFCENDLNKKRNDAKRESNN